MRRGCAKAVQGLLKALGKAGGLYTLSTVLPKYLTSQVFFIRRLCAASEQFYGRYTQLVLTNSNLIFINLCPVSTVPTNKTNLIKEL